MSMNSSWARSGVSCSLIAVCCAALILAGCERKERVLDVQTPGADVEVDRHIDTGEIEVNVEED
jgi:hypothetical protein